MTCYRNRSALAVGLACAAAALSWAASRHTQRPRVPAPPPSPFQSEKRYAIEMTQRATFSPAAGAVSEVVAQVVEVEQEPPVRWMVREGGALVVDPSPDPPGTSKQAAGPTDRAYPWTRARSARLWVVETLSGATVRGEIVLQNPPDPVRRRLWWSGPDVPTRELRLGEYCIVCCDPRTRRVIVDPYHSTMVHLSGPDDPILALVKRNNAWLARHDLAAVYSEARAVVLNPRVSNIARATAYGPMLMAAMAGRRIDDMPPPVYASLQHTLMEILKDKSAPAELKDQAINELRMDIDARKPIVKGSDDEFNLRYLLRLLFDKDTMRAAKAGERLYYICIQAGTLARGGVAYYYPDIIEALEARRDQDQAMDATHPGVGQGVLNNLTLAHRRSLAEMRQQTTVVIRRLP